MTWIQSKTTETKLEPNTSPEKQIIIQHPKLINLSSKEVTKTQLNTLKRGLKFTLTPRENKIELKSYIQEVIQKWRLVEYFGNLF